MSARRDNCDLCIDALAEVYIYGVCGECASKVEAICSPYLAEDILDTYYGRHADFPSPKVRKLLTRLVDWTHEADTRTGADPLPANAERLLHALEAAADACEEVLTRTGWAPETHASREARGVSWGDADDRATRDALGIDEARKEAVK